MVARSTLTCAVALFALIACGRERREAPKPAPEAVDMGAPAKPALRYASRVVELHLDAPDGPIVGKAHPGARLEAMAAGPGTVRVAVPWFKGPSDQPLSLFAEAAAFATTPVAPVAAPLPPGAEILRDIPSVALRTSDGGSASFASSRCGRLRLLRRGESSSQVAQVHRGVELIGWIDGVWGDVRRGPFACEWRSVTREDDGRLVHRVGEDEADAETVAAVPEGYVRLDAARSGQLPRALSAGQTMHWLVLDARNRAVCRAWTFRGATRGGEAILAMSAPTVYNEKKAFASFAVRLEQDGQSMLLFGPHFSSRPRLQPTDTKADLGGYRCARSYTLLGELPEALRLGGVSARTVAWHPDDEERWYRSAEACEAAAARANEALARDPEAEPPGGVHRDCYPELSR